MKNYLTATFAPNGQTPIWVYGFFFYEARTAFVGFWKTYEEFGAYTKTYEGPGIHMGVLMFKTPIWLS